jgi:hypothetical protein
MIGAQQLGTVAPGQITQVQPGQLTTAPGVSTLQISDMLNAILPLISIMLVFMMITPMMRGMAEAFKAK